MQVETEEMEKKIGAVVRSEYEAWYVDAIMGVLNLGWKIWLWHRV